MADGREPDRDDGPELWLGELLGAAADEYQPDADRLKALVYARIAQQSEESGASAVSSGRGRGDARARGTRRGLGLLGRLGLAGIPAGVALATIGAAAAIAVGATATIAVTSSHGDQPVTVAGPSTRPGNGGGSSPSSSPTEAASSAATSATTRPASPGTASSTSAATSSNLVSAAASIGQATNPNWAELDLVITIKQPLTALHVTVKVSKCDGLMSTGSWNTGASGQFTEQTATDSGGSITYEFELAKGDRAEPGKLTFAVQFNHAIGAWQPQNDTYYVSARTASSAGASAASGAY